jgi:hypothetical protein
MLLGELIQKRGADLPGPYSGGIGLEPVGQEPAVRQVSSPEAQMVFDAMVQNLVQNHIPVVREPGGESITSSFRCQEVS